MATNFLWAAGTNGYIISPFSLLTTELNTLTTGSTATSSVNGTSGVFSQTSTSNAMWAYFWFKSGGSFTPTGAPNISLWFLNSTDGGTTFELGTAAGRNPDVIIPLPAAAITVNQIFYSPVAKLWTPSVKIFVQNNSGVSLAGSGNIVTCGPISASY